MLVLGIRTDRIRSKFRTAACYDAKQAVNVERPNAAHANSWYVIRANYCASYIGGFAA